MERIVFVILHYETIKDTKECIDSLLNYSEDKNIFIVVVDNGSVNGKLSMLEKFYKKNKQIKFLYSEKNLGFAKGNNIGFLHAKYKLNADIIVLANNDIVFESKKFIEILKYKTKTIKFDVAGPKIISLVDNKNQNPVPRIYNNIYDVKKRLLKFKILYFLSIFNLDICIRKLLSQKINTNIDSKKIDFQLHGACMIFANEYIKRYDGLFEKTFMYGEESILKYIIERDNLKMEYLDELLVYHKEGSSTYEIFGEGKAKRQFFYKWNIDGCKWLLEIMAN